MKATALIVAALAAAPVQAQQSPSAPGTEVRGPFAPFFSATSPECASAAAVEKAGVKTQALREATFRFVQALYLLSPPQSFQLPPGDRAEIVTDGQGTAAAILIDGHQSCARLLLPPPVLSMVLRVTNGEYAHIGEGT